MAGTVEYPEHVLAPQRDEFERRFGITYCRRCGRPVVIDSEPERIAKPCQVLKVVIRTPQLGRSKRPKP